MALIFLLIISAAFYVYSRAPKERIRPSLEQNLGILAELSNSPITAFYFIKDVNLICRSLPQYDEYRDQHIPHYFFFDFSYSDPDIENFKRAFNVPYWSVATRIGKRLHYLFEKSRNLYGDGNFVCVFTSDGKLLEMKRF